MKTKQPRTKKPDPSQGLTPPQKDTLNRIRARCGENSACEVLYLGILDMKADCAAYMKQARPREGKNASGPGLGKSPAPSSPGSGPRIVRRETEQVSEKHVDGDQVAFPSGAVRSADAEGTRYDLITPIGLRRVAETCAEGAVKYSPFNWEKGMPVADLLNHAIRHTFAYLEGDRSEDHLAHAAWNMLAAIHSEEKWPELNKDSLRSRGCTPPAHPARVSPPSGDALPLASK